MTYFERAELVSIDILDVFSHGKFSKARFHEGAIGNPEKPFSILNEIIRKYMNLKMIPLGIIQVDTKSEWFNELDYAVQQVGFPRYDLLFDHEPVYLMQVERIGKDGSQLFFAKGDTFMKAADEIYDYLEREMPDYHPHHVSALFVANVDTQMLCNYIIKTLKDKMEETRAIRNSHPVSNDTNDC